MYRQLTCSMSLVLVLGLGLTSTAKADLAGWWKLDEGSGTTASDASGKGNKWNVRPGPASEGGLGEFLYP